MKKDKQVDSEASALSSSNLDTSSVLEGAEPWEAIETKLVLGSLLAAAIALAIGLYLVPTSILY